MSRQRMTIFAPATADSMSAIGIMRLSGPNSLDVIELLTTKAVPEHRYFAQRRLRDPTSNDVIDEVGVFVFRAPQSYTGEDVVEIHHHGSTAIRRELMAVLAKQSGCRVADPGEFTKRALLNGRMDLLAAEGVQALIAAETKIQARQAISAVSGESDFLLRTWRKLVLGVLARLEAEIDFGEDEEIGSVVDAETISAVDAMIVEMRHAVEVAPMAERVRRGTLVALTGPPNSGKSSLLNVLAKREVAIVSGEAGTTRDALEVHLDLNGMAVTLVDTAGIREPVSTVEKIGIERALQIRRNADLVLELCDRPNALSLTDDDRSVPILSKADLWSKEQRKVAARAIPVSSVTGEGIDQLLAILSERVGQGLDRKSALSLTSERQRETLSEAAKLLDEFQSDFDGLLDIQCERLRLAANALGRLTGRIDAEEILDEIFASFCVGK